MKNIFTYLLVFVFLLDPFKLGFLAGYPLVLITFLSLRKNIRLLDLKSGALFLFSIVYSIFYVFNLDLGAQYIYIYALFPICFYLLGKQLYLSKESFFKKQESLLLLSIMFSVTSILSVGRVLLERGFNILNRNVPDFWTGVVVNATYTGAFLMLNMTFLGILFFSWKKLGFFKSLLVVVIFLISLLCVLRLGSRTHLVIGFFGIVCSLLYLASKQSSKKNFFLLLGLFVVSNIGLGYVSLDNDSDLITAYTDRMDSRKYGANTAGGRTELWEKSIENIFKEPLGWDRNEFGYSHNLWLDVLRVGGILSFLLLLINTFIDFKGIIVKLKKNITLDAYLGTLTIFFMAFNLLFLVEPIFEGYFQIFVVYSFLMGLINAYQPPVMQKE